MNIHQEMVQLYLFWYSVMRKHVACFMVAKWKGKYVKKKNLFLKETVDNRESII